MKHDIIDWDKVSYLISRLEQGALTKGALIKRIHYSLKKEDKGEYLTLKLVQANLIFTTKKG